MWICLKILRVVVVAAVVWFVCGAFKAASLSGELACHFPLQIRMMAVKLR